MTAPLPRGLRILIGAESFADAQQALRLVDRLGDAMIADLAGLMVEDDRLTVVPRLARQRLVTAGGALADLPDPRGAARWRDTDADAFRAMLATVARQRSWRFDRAVGGLATAAARLAEYDVVVLGCRAMHRVPGQVVLITTPDASSGGAGPLAAQLAAALATTVTEITGDIPRLSAALSRMPVAAVVVGADIDLSPDALEDVIAAARCPVLLCHSGASETEKNA